MMAPRPEKLQTLRDYLRHLGLTLEGGDNPHTSDYAKLIEASRARPDFAAIQTLCLRSMQQAIYSPEQTGHFGLAYEHYAHTSLHPSGATPTCWCIASVRGVLRQQAYRPPVLPGPSADANLPARVREQDAWEALGAWLSARERRADEASRDVEAWLKCWFVREHVGEVFSGHISSVTSFGVFVTLDTLYVEGLVHISELGDDYFQFNEALNELRGERTGIRHQLGEALQVQVSRVDLEARRIDFRLVRGEDFKSMQAELSGGGSHKPTHTYKKAGRAPNQRPSRGRRPASAEAEAKRAARQTTPRKKHS
ncbi:Ribonuclease R OS=Castellaniella defragrans OX=75697 GN=rnr PE=3 SV=1 [Castellaniella defragrans]